MRSAEPTEVPPNFMTMSMGCGRSPGYGLSVVSGSNRTLVVSGFSRTYSLQSTVIRRGASSWMDFFELHAGVNSQLPTSNSQQGGLGIGSWNLGVEASLVLFRRRR